MSDRAALNVFLVAGEPSGDALGGRLMASLRALTDDKVRFSGVGGGAMEAQGLASLFPISELSVMGLFEVLPHILQLRRRLHEIAAAIDATRPDVVVTIDSPSFTHRLANLIHDRRILRVHYVAPQVWAWRPWRVHEIRKSFDMVLALLPFEPRFFEDSGVPCRFVGHPVVEYGAEKADGAAFRRAHDIGPEQTVICVLPGSRRSEVTRLAAIFGATLGLLARDDPSLTAVVPMVPGVAALVRDLSATWPVRTVLVEGRDEKYAAMTASNAAIAASGTVTLETAMARVPMVVAYRLSLVTAALFRPFMRVRYVNLINLILDREAIPERLQFQCKPEILAEEIKRLLGPGGKEQVEAVAEAIAALGAGDEPPSRRAARAILDVVEGRNEDAEQVAGTSAVR